MSSQPYPSEFKGEAVHTVLNSALRVAKVSQRRRLTLHVEVLNLAEDQLDRGHPVHGNILDHVLNLCRRVLSHQNVQPQRRRSLCNHCSRLQTLEEFKSKLPLISLIDQFETRCNHYIFCLL